MTDDHFHCPACDGLMRQPHGNDTPACPPMSTCARAGKPMDPIDRLEYVWRAASTGDTAACFADAG